MAASFRFREGGSPGETGGLSSKARTAYSFHPNTGNADCIPARHFVVRFEATAIARGRGGHGGRTSFATKAVRGAHRVAVRYGSRPYRAQQRTQAFDQRL